jgi:uncharacterized membrane-anchored protein
LNDIDDVTAELEHALSALGSKLEGVDGMDGVSGWVRQVEEAIAAIPRDGIRTTRDEIRSLIDELMELNAAVQNLARLKQLLS